MTDDDLPTLEELEDLFVNNTDLESIRAHLGRFNPIKTMGAERTEIRHSAVLAWLLNPQETHGLGDKFLKAFLTEALRGYGSTQNLSALDVYQADLTDAEIRREWRHIDLLILSPRNGWIFVIENKFDSSQHSNQLKRYMETVNSAFMGGDTFQSVVGVFLTLWEEEAKDDRYAPIAYAAICELLEQQALSGGHPLTAEVETFLKHYLEVIREATGMSKEQNSLEKLARQLYRDHRRVLDFIVRYGKATDFTIACEGVFGEQPEYPDTISIDGHDFIFHHADGSTVSFLPRSWFDALGGGDFEWEGCEDWWAGFPLIMWVRLTADSEGSSGQVRLYAEVGPLEDSDFRRDLIEAITRAADERGLTRIGFQQGASEEGRKYSKFFKRNSHAVDDVQDSEKITNAMLKVLRSFSSEIDAVADILPEFRSRGKSESSE